PDTVRLVLERRLERLGEKTRAVLTAAAALGPCFRFELRQALQDHIALDDLLASLNQAQRLGLLVSSANRQDANSAVAHGLVCQTLLASISGAAPPAPASQGGRGAHTDAPRGRERARGHDRPSGGGSWHPGGEPTSRVLADTSGEEHP